MSKPDIFDAYRDDARAALDAWPNVDPDGYRLWSDHAEEKQYLVEYRRWLRTQIKSTEKVDAARAKGEVRLFEPPEPSAVIEMRSVIIHDGREYALADLAGETGAAILRAAMIRDLKPATTTVARCKNGLALAECLAQLSEIEGRDVSVAEVMGWRDAA